MKSKKAAKKLRSLGNRTKYNLSEADPSLLETFDALVDNYSPPSEYCVTFETSEFTSLCPKTGQPDFGKITISYRPNKNCIESKSLKLYLFSYRNTGAFMEEIVNNILRDVSEACLPHEMTVTGTFVARGGITTVVRAAYVSNGV